MDLTQMRLEFNRYLLDAIGGEVLSNSIFSWNTGVTQTILGFCLAIAFFQSVLKSEKEFLLEWTKIIIATWFCMAILGGVKYTNVPVFSRLNNVPQEYKPKGNSPVTLERAAFNYLAYTFDRLGKAMLSTTSGSLTTEIAKLNNMQSRFIAANVNCTKNDVTCLKKALSTDPLDVVEEDKKEAGLLDSMNPAYWFSKVYEIVVKLTNPFYLLFGGLMWLLEIIRAFVNYFILLAYGLISAISLFMIKIICPAMVIPSYRGRILKALKVVAAASMFGFITNLIIYISIVITKALNAATANILVAKITGDGALAALPELGSLMIGNFLTSLVIVAMQIVAMTRVPKMARQLMELSLEEFINIGETLVGAGLGLAKIAAGVAVGAAGLGAGALLARTTGMTGGQLGANTSNFFRRKFGASESPVPGMGGGDDGGSGSADSAFFRAPSGGLNRMGGSGSLERAALGEATTQAAGSSASGSSVSTAAIPANSLIDRDAQAKDKEVEATKKLKEQMTEINDNPSLTVEEKNQKIAEAAGKMGDAALVAEKRKQMNQGQNLNRPATAFDKAASRGAFMDRMGSYMPKDLGGLALDTVFDSMSVGAGVGSSIGLFDKGSRSFAKQFNEDKADIANYLQGSEIERRGGPTTTSGQRAAMAEQVVQSGYLEKQAVDEKEFSDTMGAIATGNASNEQMIKALSMRNSSNLSDSQSSLFNDVASKNQSFGDFVKKEDETSKRLIEQAQKEIQSSEGLNQMSNKTMRDLASRTNAGLIDTSSFSKEFDTVKRTEDGGFVSDDKGNPVKFKTDLLKSLDDIASRETDTTLQKLSEKVKQGGLSKQDLNEAAMLSRYAPEQIMGNSQRVQTMNSLFSGTRDFSYLDYSRDEVAMVASGMAQSLSQGIDPSKDNPEVRIGQDLSIQLSKSENNEYEVVGFKVGSKDVPVTSLKDLQGMQQEDQRLFKEMVEYLDKYYLDSRTRSISAVNKPEQEMLNKLGEFLSKSGLAKSIKK